MSDHSQSTKNARNALCRAFPSPRAFRNFKENDLKISPHALKNILDLAEAEGLIAPDHPSIPYDRESAFIKFLAMEALERQKQIVPSMPSELGFDGYLRIFWEETQIKSATLLVENLNAIAQNLGMAPVQESMVSRLKAQFNLNTPKKRNFVRLLCFWIGVYAPQTLPWDYHTFQNLPSGETKPPLSQEPEGVRLSFIVSEKKKADWICRELAGSLKYLQYHHLESRDIGHFERIVSLDIPKLAGPSREPTLYGKAIAEALALAHQVVVRWLLTESHDPDTRMAALVSAGVFDTMETNIPLMQPASGSMGACIRISTFARLCARMAESKVVFSVQPDRFEINGQIEEIWAIKGFWPSYFEFVPQLFEPDAIPQKIQHYQTFKDSLFLADQSMPPTFRALAAIKRYPQNSFVILEVFKALLHRRMFMEANEVLSTLLAAEPTNIIARSMRIASCFYLAMKHAFQPSISNLYFDRAVREGQYVEAHCHIDDEEFRGDMGRVHLGRALRDMRMLREGKSRQGINLETVTNSLKRSLECFEKGAIESPAGKGTQSIFWMIHLKSLIEILETDQNIFTRPGPLTDEKGAYLKNGMEYLIFLGWMDPEDNQHIFKRTQTVMNAYSHSSQLSAMTPYSLYSFSAFLHDMVPVMTVGMVRKILVYLKEAEKAAIKPPSNMGLYSIGNCFCLIQSQREFVECAVNAGNAIQEKYSKYLETAHDDIIIPWGERRGLRLCLLNLDYQISRNALFLEEDPELE